METDRGKEDCLGGCLWRGVFVFHSNQAVFWRQGDWQECACRRLCSAEWPRTISAGGLFPAHRRGRASEEGRSGELTADRWPSNGGPWVSSGHEASGEFSTKLESNNSAPLPRTVLAPIALLFVAFFSATSRSIIWRAQAAAK